MIKVVGNTLVVFAFFLISGLFFKVSAQTPAPYIPISCEISVYKTQDSNLPVTSRIKVTNGDDLSVGSRYVYTFNVKSLSVSQNKINKVTLTPVAGSMEPVTIFHVLAPFGPCTISSDKRIECSGSYSYFEESTEPVEVLLSPYYESGYPFTSWNVFVETDYGNASCFSNNKILSPPKNTPVPNQLPAVTNLRVDGYRNVSGTEYKEAIIAWNPIATALRYEIMSVGTEIYSIGGTEDTKYIIRFHPSSNWYIAIYAQDRYGNRGVLSDTLTVQYDGVDSLPATSSGIIQPSATPTPFDSSKIAILEQKISDLEKTQQSQETRLGILESIIESLKRFFSRIFRTS